MYKLVVINLHGNGSYLHRDRDEKREKGIVRGRGEGGTEGRQGGGQGKRQGGGQGERKDTKGLSLTVQSPAQDRSLPSLRHVGLPKLDSDSSKSYRILFPQSVSHATETRFRKLNK